MSDSALEPQNLICSNKSTNNIRKIMSFEGNLPNRTLGRGRVFELTPIKTGERGSLTRSNDQRGSLTKSNEQRGSVASNFSNEDSKRGSMASRTGRDGYLVGRAHQKKGNSKCTMVTHELSFSGVA